MAALDKIPNLYRSLWFENERKSLQKSVDRDESELLEGLLAKVKDNEDETVLALPTPEADLAGKWRAEFGEREGVGYLVFTVAIVCLTGMFIPTPLPLTILVVFSVFLALSIVGWIVGSARAVDAMEKIVRSSPAWKRTIYIVGRKGIYATSHGECCPFDRVTAVEAGEDDSGPFVAYREDTGRSAYQQKIRCWKRGMIDEARRVAALMESMARSANPDYYEEGRRGKKARGTHASI